MWRHGDVLIAAVAGIPQGAKERPDVILARGETTGHMHRVEVPATAELWECKGQLYMKVIAESARLVHEEHNPIVIPRGIYRVWKQREYTPTKIVPVRD